MTELETKNEAEIEAEAEDFSDELSDEALDGLAGSIFTYASTRGGACLPCQSPGIEGDRKSAARLRLQGEPAGRIV